jgi:hypothetical protein
LVGLYLKDTSRVFFFIKVSPQHQWIHLPLWLLHLLTTWVWLAALTSFIH